MNSDATKNSKTRGIKQGACTASSDEEQFARLLKIPFQYFEHSGEALINSGAIHRFIFCHLNRKFGLIIQSTSLLQVTLADGSIVDRNSLVSVPL